MVIINQSLPEAALLRWQKFATRSVAVFCLTYHRSVGVGGKYRCTMHHALLVNHLSHYLPLMPHHNTHVTATAVVNNTIFTRCDAIVAAMGCVTHCRDDRLVQQCISRLIALVVPGTKYPAATCYRLKL